ncbi:hypothetical protein [Mycobacterium kyogaense]|uniref:hypothetical protein n=1 Tax=Mycobacterium kyogaense TaxID=2212479 RepID=UPI0013C52C55|nr:hypothetical protein [Mycobacterium kyogaense]
MEYTGVIGPPSLMRHFAARAAADERAQRHAKVSELRTRATTLIDQIDDLLAGHQRHVDHGHRAVDRPAPLWDEQRGESVLFGGPLNFRDARGNDSGRQQFAAFGGEVLGLEERACRIVSVR